MSDELKKDFRNTDTILHNLQVNWAIAYGAITLPLILAMWIPKLVLPLLIFIEAWAIISAMRANYRGLFDQCSLILTIASRVLLISSAVMFLIAVLCTDYLVPTVIHLDLYNSEIPFVTCLVVFPVTAIVCAVWLFAGIGDKHSRECQRRNGYYAGDSITATLYHRETRYQVGVLLILALALGAVEYWYYFARYINSDMNAPDRFFFNYIPAIMYLLSLVFVYGRYTSMKVLYEALDAANPSKQNRTLVRYLIFSLDELLLHPGKDGLLDTPAEAVIGRVPSIGTQRARLIFEEMTGIDKFDIRYCFTNDGFASGSNIIHYAVFITPEQKSAFEAPDEWANPYMLDKALATNALSPLLANELYRIHTITMAWKTYDRQGRRLYPIRHYRPTFRFRDMPDWEVDYDDQTWFDVAHNNEDRSFYRLRLLWNRFTGLFTKQAEE